MTNAALTPEPVRIEPETAFDAAGVARVVERAFGPGRFAKTAERLREGSEPICGFVARRDGQVIGSVRLWPIAVGDVSAAFLGPIAVDADERSVGVGADLVAACLACIESRGVAGVLLVGDLPYFGRFGFEAAPGVALPGPVDRRRVLWRGVDGASPPVGLARIA